MAYGAKFVNDSGTIQIDDTFQNYELKTAGTISVPAYGSYGTVTYTGSTKAIIAIRPQNGFGVVIRSVVYNSGTGIKTWRFWTDTACNLDYYIFDVPDQTTPLPTYGMVLRDAAGQITFRSDKKYMRVAGMHSILSNTGSFSQQYDGSKSYAVVLTGDTLYTNNKRTIGAGVGAYDVWDLWFFKIFITSGNLISCGPKYLADTSSEKGPYKFASLYAMVVDVTNYQTCKNFYFVYLCFCALTRFTRTKFMKKLIACVLILSLCGCANGQMKLHWTEAEIADYRAKHPDGRHYSPEALKKDMEEHPAFYRKTGACQNILKDREGRIYLGC